MDSVVEMSTGRPSRSWKVVVQFERRDDGGVRAWCDAVPGFVLSHRNADAVLLDVQPALEGILSAQLGREIITTQLDDIRLTLERCGVVDPTPTSMSYPHSVEYAALCA